MAISDFLSLKTLKIHFEAPAISKSFIRRLGPDFYFLFQKFKIGLFWLLSYMEVLDYTHYSASVELLVFFGFCFGDLEYKTPQQRLIAPPVWLHMFG